MSSWLLPRSLTGLTLSFRERGSGTLHARRRLGTRARHSGQCRKPALEHRNLNRAEDGPFARHTSRSGRASLSPKYGRHPSRDRPSIPPILPLDKASPSGANSAYGRVHLVSRETIRAFSERRPTLHERRESNLWAAGGAEAAVQTPQTVPDTVFWLQVSKRAQRTLKVFDDRNVRGRSEDPRI